MAYRLTITANPRFQPEPEVREGDLGALRAELSSELRDEVEGTDWTYYTDSEPQSRLDLAQLLDDAPDEDILGKDLSYGDADYEPVAIRFEQVAA